MDADDIIFFALLLVCVVFGHWYTKIESVEKKKWTGTAFGLVMMAVLARTEIWHIFVTVLVNAVIILFAPRRICHLASFAFSFLYLIFFRTSAYFGIPYSSDNTGLIEMLLVLKVVGLAFEVNSAYMSLKQKSKLRPGYSNAEYSDDFDLAQPTFLDVIHYSFSYIGVLTGPYYQYKTFLHYFKLPFARHVNCREETLRKLTYLPLYCLLFVLTSSIWPLSYATSDEFYEKRSVAYRIWYVYPSFFIFRMKIYIGLTLSECICMMAGFGAYPEKCDPKPGHGPSKLNELNVVAKADHEQLRRMNYNFKTINNVNPSVFEVCTTNRDAVKNWNVCIQYWLAVYVYKRFPIKSLRTLATMMVSAIWHGVYPGHYICLIGAAFSFVLEDVYAALFAKNNRGLSRKAGECFQWFLKTTILSWLGFPFLLLTLPEIRRYFASVHYIGFYVGIILYVAGMGMLALRRAHKHGGSRISTVNTSVNKSN